MKLTITAAICLVFFAKIWAQNSNIGKLKVYFIILIVIKLVLNIIIENFFD